METKFCKKCGSSITPEMKFCKNCGWKIENVNSQEIPNSSAQNAGQAAVENTPVVNKPVVNTPLPNKTVIAPQPVKKRNIGLIIAIVAAVFVLLTVIGIISIVKLVSKISQSDMVSSMESDLKTDLENGLSSESAVEEDSEMEEDLLISEEELDTELEDIVGIWNGTGKMVSLTGIEENKSLLIENGYPEDFAEQMEQMFSDEAPAKLSISESGEWQISADFLEDSTYYYSYKEFLPEDNIDAFDITSLYLIPKDGVCDITAFSMTDIFPEKIALHMEVNKKQETTLILTISTMLDTGAEKPLQMDFAFDLTEHSSDIPEEFEIELNQEEYDTTENAGTSQEDIVLYLPEFIIGNWLSDSYNDGSYLNMNFNEDMTIDVIGAYKGKASDSINTWNTGEWYKDDPTQWSYSIDGDTINLYSEEGDFFSAWTVVFELDEEEIMTVTDEYGSSIIYRKILR